MPSMGQSYTLDWGEGSDGSLHLCWTCFWHGFGSRICFESLEFADIEGPAPVNGLLPGQALRFGDLDFVADLLGQL